MGPRDALVADLAPAEVRGASYGLRQSLDSVGAFTGPLITIALMMVFAGDNRAVFWAAFVPGILAVLVLAVAVREPAACRGTQQQNRPLVVRRELLGRLGPECWLVLFVAATLTLARFSEAFLVLRAADLGLSGLRPGGPGRHELGLRGDSLSGWPTIGPGGTLGSSRHRRGGSDRSRLLAAADSLVAAAVGVALWGLHMGMTQGILTTLIADAAPADLRGTAFGLLHFLSDVALLGASVPAGWLWYALGAPAPFVAGAVISGIALLGISSRPWMPTQSAKLRPPRGPPGGGASHRFLKRR